MVLMGMSTKSLAASPHGCPSLPSTPWRTRRAPILSRAHLRTDFFDKRRELMDAWALRDGVSVTPQIGQSPKTPRGPAQTAQAGLLMPDAPSKVDPCAGPDAGANHYVYYFRCPNPLPRPARRGSRYVWRTCPKGASGFSPEPRHGVFLGRLDQ